ncbi:MAG: nitroreductase family protein [Actinomycetota bacterium]
MTDPADTVSDPLVPVSLIEGLSTTRAIRRYTDRPIPDADLHEIIRLAGCAPSGSNRQRFRFLLLRDGERSQRARAVLGESFRRGWAAKREGDGYRPSRFADSMQHFVDSFESIPVVVIVCLDRYRDPDVYEGASVYPACQNLLLGARALGYGGALTMWHLAVEDQLREILEIPEHVALSACVTLGEPAGRHGPLRRKAPAEIAFDDVWGRSPGWD